MTKYVQKDNIRQKVAKVSLSLLCAVHLLLDMEPYLVMFYIPSEIPLAWTNFSCASRCQLKIVSWLVMEDSIYTLLELRLQVWACAGFVHATSICEFLLFGLGFPCPLVLSPSASYSVQFPETLKEGLDKYIPFSSEHFEVFI